VTLAASELALRLARNAHPENPRHPSLIYLHDVHGRNLGDAGQMHPAIAEMDQALRDASDVFGPSSQMVGFLAGNIAPLQRWVGDIRPSLESSNRSIGILAKHAQSDSYTYAIQYTTRGVTWLAARRGAEALKDLATSRETFGRIFGPSHWDTLTAQFNGAIALAYLGRIDEAQRELQPVRDRSPDVANRMWSLYVLGMVERFAGDYQAALREQLEGLGLITGSKAKWNRVRALVEVGLDQLELGRHDEAIASLEEARALYLELETRMHPARAEVLVGLGRAHLGRGDGRKALPMLEEAVAFWRDFDPENRWAGEAALWLGRCYRSLGNSGAAGRALSRAEEILSRSPIPGDARLVALARAR
jgi:tetratricopeptide (TPR) repeat protein